MDRIVWTMARIMAILGGLVLLALILLTCVSILGRMLNGLLNGNFLQTLAPGLSAWALDLGIGPILGHVEIVEAGIAFAIFAFLPICQLSGVHAKVNLFTDRLPCLVRRWWVAGIDTIFAATLLLIAWRLSEGLVEKREFSETSFMLQFPIWWAYFASLVAAITAVIAGLYIAVVRIAEAVTGTDRLGMDQGPVA